MEGGCQFCHCPDSDDIKTGEFHKMDSLQVHYYCLLFSSNLEQKGKDSEGILGFLPQDINKELKRGTRLLCSYCHKSGATIGCSIKECKKQFHYPCGLERGSLYQFYGQFRAYCCVHRPMQKLPKDYEPREVSWTCSICMEPVPAMPAWDTLLAPCCRNWFHRLCVQKNALHSGYFFQCPYCREKKKFVGQMKLQGIYVPDRDASWEQEPNAFQDLLIRHNRCDAKQCKCPGGRTQHTEGTRWEVIRCQLCGSQGIHITCGNLQWMRPKWTCPGCKKIAAASGHLTGEDDHTEESPRASVTEADDRDATGQTSASLRQSSLDGYFNSSDRSVPRPGKKSASRVKRQRRTSGSSSSSSVDIKATSRPSPVKPRGGGTARRGRGRRGGAGRPSQRPDKENEDEPEITSNMLEKLRFRVTGDSSVVVWADSDSEETAKRMHTVKIPDSRESQTVQKPKQQQTQKANPEPPRRKLPPRLKEIPVQHRWQAIINGPRAREFLKKIDDTLAKWK